MARTSSFKRLFVTDEERAESDAIQAVSLLDDPIFYFAFAGVKSAFNGLRVMLTAGAARTAATNGAVTVADSLAAGAVNPSGTLIKVLRAIEAEFAIARPSTAETAMEVVQKAVAIAEVELGFASTLPSGAIVLKNAGGVVTTVATTGSITVQRGSEILLRAIP